MSAELDPTLLGIGDDDGALRLGQTVLQELTHARLQLTQLRGHLVCLALLSRRLSGQRQAQVSEERVRSDVVRREEGRAEKSVIPVEENH